MASTKMRSFIKGLVWELSGPFILYGFTQEWTVIVGYTAVRIVLYYFYERIWKWTRWGKVEGEG